MQNADTDSSPMSFAGWVVWCVSLTMVVAIVALAIPARFRFHGLFNVALGVAIGTGCHWIAGDFGQRLVPALTSNRRTAIAVVVLLALAGQTAVSAGHWLKYRAAVRRTWKDDPTTMITARMHNGQIETTESNGQQQLIQMKQLFDANAAQRMDALKTRSGFTTWIVKRVDRRTGIKSPETAIAFWFGEVCLGCLAALFGFVRRPSNDQADDVQTA